jgi:hypothetical protein
VAHIGKETNFPTKKKLKEEERKADIIDGLSGEGRGWEPILTIVQKVWSSFHEHSVK